MSVWRLWNQSWNIVATASSDEWIRWTSCLFSSIRPTAAFKRVWKMETKSYVSDRNWCDWRGTVSRPPNAPDPSLWEDQEINYSQSHICVIFYLDFDFSQVLLLYSWWNTSRKVDVKYLSWMFFVHHAISHVLVGSRLIQARSFYVQGISSARHIWNIPSSMSSCTCMTIVGSK